MNENRIITFVLFLGAVGAIYYWSTTEQGATTIANAVDNVSASLSGQARGVRNNNPGNIVRNNIQWQGSLNQAQVEALGWQWDPTFVQFDTPLNGLRALARIILVYNQRGENTVDEIISTFAPPQENDTAAYENFVAAEIGQNPGTPFNVASKLGSIMAAITQRENTLPGVQWVDPYGDALYVQAIAAASQNVPS